MQWYTYQKHKPSLILVWRTMKQSTKKPLARTVRELPSAVKRSSKVTIILGSNNRIYLIIAHLRINQPRSHKFLCCYTMNDNVCKSMRKEIGLSIYSSKFFQRICRNTISRFFDIGPHQSLRFLWNFISINPPPQTRSKYHDKDPSQAHRECVLLYSLSLPAPYHNHLQYLHLKDTFRNNASLCQ